ncbi:hypothetical protein TURU_027271 [Turdus rufiventris]|nr:hypothetical protein TURU_027271 [Turdus rufiventris]
MSGAGTALPSPPPAEGERPLSPSQGSPLSLASRSSSPGCDEEQRLAASRSPPGLRRAEHSEIAGGRKVSLLKDNLSPWEEWFISKEKELRARLQDRAAEERRERKRKVSKEMAEKATRELEKMQLQEKADIKYKEWLKKKRAEEAEKKKKEKGVLIEICIQPQHIVTPFLGNRSLLKQEPDKRPDHCNETPYQRLDGFFHVLLALLVYDSMHAHKTGSVKALVKKTNSELAVIPGGLTKEVQPLDTNVIHSFKANLRIMWENWMVEGDQSFTNTRRLRQASYATVCQWTVDAWGKVSTRAVIQGFVKADIIPGLTSDGIESSGTDDSDG